LVHNHAALRPDSLVLYKIRPARVLTLGEKIEIELEGGQIKRVRAKDVRLLHPGPLKSLADLNPREGELAAAWELLEGSETSLGELAELMFDEDSPATAWATWQLIAEGLYFEGIPEAVRVRTREEVEKDQAERAAKIAAARDWEEFLERTKQARPEPQDADRLGEIVRLALGETTGSRILRALGYQETSQNAHRALIDVGYWPPDYNPYPGRNQLPMVAPDLPVQDLLDEGRLDLTHLPAYAIDDEGNQDPDDALSLDGDRIWVHVADVAALVTPNSRIDLEARARGSNQYLPERTVNMLPEAVTERLGLGLQPVSPALSFGFRCTEGGELSDIDIRSTLVQVERLTYESAERRLAEPPFARLNVLTERYRARRSAQNAARIDLPEVSVRVRGDEVTIRQLPKLRSRALVMDAMLMAGEAAAEFCLEREIPIPFATQSAPEKIEQPADLAAMYAYRRRFKPTRLVIDPEPHFGLGLSRYTRATSPLRRYSDLLVHQQIRAWLAGTELHDAQEVTRRIAEAEQAAIAVRRSERLSNQHWKLVYLRANPDWRGEGVLVEKGEHKAVVLIPELALETRVRLRGDLELNTRVEVMPREVDLPELTCYFRVREDEGVP
jgi:exoribonuclease-2